MIGDMGAEMHNKAVIAAFRNRAATTQVMYQTLIQTCGRNGVPLDTTTAEALHSLSGLVYNTAEGPRTDRINAWNALSKFSAMVAALLADEEAEQQKQRAAKEQEEQNAKENNPELEPADCDEKEPS